LGTPSENAHRRLLLVGNTLSYGRRSGEDRRGEKVRTEE
jgi:hypothetical protein